MAKKITSVGDVNPIEYGGGFVYSEDGNRWIEYTSGVEDVEDAPMEGDPGYEDIKLTVYLVAVEDDVFGWHSWAKIADIARTSGYAKQDLKAAGKSSKLRDRVWATEAIAGMWGWYELDNYPITLTVAELGERWKLNG